MSHQEPLLGEFTAPDLAEWKTEVERLLKGADFDRRMFTRTLEGLTVGPMYTGVPAEGNPQPGQPPFVRGRTAAGYQQAPWLIAQELPLPTVTEFNTALRRALTRGQTAVQLVLDQAGMWGLDPDQAATGQVGNAGTSVASVHELRQALAGVDLSRVPLFMEAGSSALSTAAMLLALCRDQGVDPADLRGCVGSDPLYGLAGGNLPLDPERLYDELAVLANWSHTSAPGLKTLPVFEDPWHDGGADSALGLGLLLASAVETLRAMETRGVPLETAVGRIRFNICLGTDFFMEMAKVRALRRLWTRIVEAAGLPTDLAKVEIHARTSRRTLTKLDAHVNMLRVTTAAMSGVLGGVDSLHVSPFDEVDSVPDAFSRRIARNVQLILAHECHFDHVIDPAGGSGYVENLTDELAREAWSIFQEVETDGGLRDGLETGRIQVRVRAVAARRAEALAVGRAAIVGSNRYADPLEAPRAPRQPDFESLRTARAADVASRRTAGSQTEHLKVLGRLEKVLAAEPADIMEKLARAAEAGATLGELTRVLRPTAVEGPLIDHLVPVRDAEPFEALRGRVAQLPARQARVFCACLGDFAAYMPRLDFVRGFFRTGGFDVVSDTWFPTADEAVAAALADGADVVALVGLDATYTDLAVPATKGLTAGDTAPQVVLAGKPGDLEDALREAGVVTFIHARSHLLATLGGLVVPHPSDGNTEVQS